MPLYWLSGHKATDESKIYADLRGLHDHDDDGVLYAHRHATRLMATDVRRH